MYAKQQFINVKIDPEDLVLVKQLMAAERLRKSDIVRRALRAYAKQLGIEVQPAKVA